MILYSDENVAKRNSCVLTSSAPTKLEKIKQHQTGCSEKSAPHNELEFEFDFMTKNQNIENIPNYFKNVKHINEVLGKPKYIHKKDECLEKDCSICLEKIEYKKYKRILPCCKNVYHKTCIDKWLKKNSSCPNCRHDFLKENDEENDDENN